MLLVIWPFYHDFMAFENFWGAMAASGYNGGRDVTNHDQLELQCISDLYNNI